MEKRHFFLIQIIGVLMLSISCQGLLEEEIHSEITDNYLSTTEGFNDGVNAAYAFLRYYYGFNEIGAATSVFGTDEFTNGFDGSLKYLNTYDAKLDPSGGYSWGDLYIAINTCNAVIGRAPNVSGIPDAIKTVRVAEVRFLRAHYYFLLVRLWGPVHLTLTETQGVQTSATRVPIKDIYDAIIEDLDFAVQNLPPTPSNYGRTTKPAAQNLLAKVYLTRATSDAKQADDYSKAAQLAKTVISDYNFSLLSNYHKIFEQGAGEKNSEVIFAIQNSKNLLTSGDRKSVV